MWILYRSARQSAGGPIPIAKTINRWKCLICFVIGHDWEQLCISTMTYDISYMAGVLADCKRCNTRWDDLPCSWEQLPLSWRE